MSAHAVRLVRLPLEVALPPEQMVGCYETGDVLIWSGEHGLYWRANRQGYTDDRAQAGRYAYADAWAATSHCGREKQIAFEPAPLLKPST